ncbi:MAG TPA: sensor domain-containing protein [Thermoleophilaceae bacterium]|nr:sensor domain-containing protein [Thermoleophilaceae bacterium]
MPVSTPGQARLSLPCIKVLLRDLLDPLTYRRIAYLLLALPLGVIEFSFLVTAISFGVSTVITLIGIPVLVGTVYAWRWLAGLERRLIGVLTGIQIASPYRPAPAGGNWWQRLQARLADPATWKDLLFLMLQLGLGIVSFTIATVVLATILGTLFAPAFYWAVPDGLQLGIVTVDTLGEAIAMVPLGALLALVGIPALGALGRLYGLLAALMLGTGNDPELTAQVTDLQDARSRIIAAGDAERRRIERDLHDGAQQRLVALALTLRMAETRAQAGDPEAVKLIQNAGDEAGLALSELRDLARGIHPAILTNRGLAAALDDLASRASVPVEVADAPEERLPDQVEAAAYFVVSECLANVDKHARASSATVAVRERDGTLTVSVSDDGRGGAGLDGSGLQGLRDRVGALSGTLTVKSPAGQGTLVTATIPLDVPEPEAELAVPIEAAPVLGDADAHALQARRVRGLWTRSAALGGLAAIILTVWALTGAPNAWPVWPSLGLALIVGLDAWRVLAGRPVCESDLPSGSDRVAGLRAARHRRSLRLDAGWLAILNLFLIGIWLAAGGGYFWPVWSILGCAVALGVKALRWPSIARERLLGDAPRDLAH